MRIERCTSCQNDLQPCSPKSVSQSTQAKILLFRKDGQSEEAESIGLFVHS